MNKNVTIDVYFKVLCDVCFSVLTAEYDDRDHTLNVEPCKCCLEQAKEEEIKRMEDEK